MPRGPGASYRASMATVSLPPASPEHHARRAANLGGRRALAGVINAVIGGAAALALALLVGAVHITTPATTIVRAAPVTSASSAPTAWAAVYSEADSGAVDIAAQTTTSVSGLFGQSQEEETALGSGFVLDGRGDIVTAEHAVAGGSSIRVAFENGTTRSATVLGKDVGSDVAVIHVNPAGLTLHPLPLGDSAALAVGEPLAVVGDPLGFDRSLSIGVVSALDRSIQALTAMRSPTPFRPTPRIADQIATGTNEFGGPSSAETSTGVGFAVPIDLIKTELVALEDGQQVTRAYLGINTGQSANGSSGALVASVQSGIACRVGRPEGRRCDRRVQRDHHHPRGRADRRARRRSRGPTGPPHGAARYTARHARHTARSDPLTVTAYRQARRL